MMRKFLKKYPVLLAMLLVAAMTLVSCAQKPAKTYDLQEVYQSVMDAQTNTGLEERVMFPETDPELIEMFYPGLTALKPVQMLLYQPPVAGFACEVMLVEMASKADAQAAEVILNLRVKEASEDTGYPDVAALWAKNARVQREGVYVCMAVMPDGYTVPADLFGE